jgi:hypothetical protein
MDRLKKPKDFLEKLRLTDSDYQDSGMIKHIADLLERYSTEQLFIQIIMEVEKQWIVNVSELLLLLKDGTYRIGKSSNLYGFDLINKEKALALINAT